jgi:hypothetical protein
MSVAYLGVRRQQQSTERPVREPETFSSGPRFWATGSNKSLETLRTVLPMSSYNVSDHSIDDTSHSNSASGNVFGAPP